MASPHSTNVLHSLALASQGKFNGGLLTQHAFSCCACRGRVFRPPAMLFHEYFLPGVVVAGPLVHHCYARRGRRLARRHCALCFGAGVVSQLFARVAFPPLPGPCPCPPVMFGFLEFLPARSLQGGWCAAGRAHRSRLFARRYHAPCVGARHGSSVMSPAL